MSVGFTVVRAQPFHKGHQKIVDKMLKENKTNFLFIGSIDSHDQQNPFSFEERKQMITRLYKDETKSKKLIIIGLKDIHNPPKWAKFVTSFMPMKGDCYYCGTGQDGKLFLNEGYNVSIIDRSDLKISGTGIRIKIRSGDNTWKKDVPSKIHTIIEEKGII